MVDPIKLAARRKVCNAVRHGKIIKPLACTRCRKIPKRSLLHGHHMDYSKPLDVEWICIQCHGREHKAKPNASQILSPDKVQELRILRASGLSFKDLSIQFGVAVSTALHY